MLQSFDLSFIPILVDVNVNVNNQNISLLPETVAAFRLRSLRSVRVHVLARVQLFFGGAG